VSVRLNWCCFFSTALMLAAPETPYVGLPNQAVLVEEQPLPAWAHADRALLLWVWPSQDKPLKWHNAYGEMGSIPEDDSDGYTCPEQSTGHSHFYRTRTRISLVDTQAHRVLNTLPIESAFAEFDIPFLIRGGYFYEAPGVPPGHAGKPHILDLKDLNGDGKPLEFVLYLMESCTGPQTRLFGYSQRKDRVMGYQFHLRDLTTGKVEVADWMLRFTFQKPISPMHWKYDYYSNSGRYFAYDFRYIPANERFEGTKLQTDAATHLQRLQQKK
jgi:hypothetical protein